MNAEYERLTSRSAVFEGIDLWNDCHPSLPIDRRLADQNVFATPANVASVARGAYVDGALRGFALATHQTGPVPGYDDEANGWLSLLVVDTTAVAVEGVGAGLLEALLDDLAAAGVERVRVGGDVRKFLAGLPTRLEPTYRSLLERFGFEAGGTVHDLYQDVSTSAAAEAVAPYRDLPADVTADRVAPREAEDLLGFLREQFPGRWAFQAETARASPGGVEDYWLLREDGDPAAFARTGTADSAVPGSCVAWQGYWGARTCGLGPIGVRESSRGRGLGLGLLAAVVDDFRERGYQHMTIDGVAPSLLDYYAKVGFDPWLEYTGFSRSE